jgi:hypothetical protein
MIYSEYAAFAGEKELPWDDYRRILPFDDEHRSAQTVHVSSGAFCQREKVARYASSVFFSFFYFTLTAVKHDKHSTF